VAAAMQGALSMAEHTASPMTMQPAYSAPMAERRPYRIARQLRLAELIAEAGGPKLLQALTGVTDTHLTACGMSKPAGWMDSHPDVPLAAGLPADAIALANEFDRLTGETRAREFARLINGIAFAAAEDAASAAQTAPSGAPRPAPAGSRLGR